ncbi:MAG TPA: hypothetical protein DEF34_06960 [Desulfotomaculum sp.]|nr:MAG: hypothetical protein JL56_12665 [Desulfotomaculum sp. BICA1-6]HBX23350.1 hypothetical protein [Desulfotomaculum sp.]
MLHVMKKCRTLAVITMVLTLVITLTATGCSKPPESPAPNKDAELSNIFEVEKIKVGQKIAGLEVTSASVDSLEWSEEPGLVAEFKGQVTLGGTYTHFENSPLLDHEIIFEVDEASAHKLPRLNIDKRDNVFVFTNHDRAEDELGPKGSSGGATIVVDNFNIYYVPNSDSLNYAELVQVMEKE